MSRSLRRGLAAAVACVALGGCSPAVTTTLPSQTPKPAPSGNPKAACNDATSTYPALSPLPKADAMPEGILSAIHGRGRIVVGVTADAAGLSARNPATGAWEGFDVDLFTDLSQSMFGTPDAVDLRVITHDQAMSALQDGDVDVVVMHYAMTCGRWANKVSFSAPYLSSNQELLVRRGAATTMKGARVCAVAGTPNVDAIPKDAKATVLKPTITQCLAAFEAGEVDAITDDAVVLAGLLKQNPYLVRVPTSLGTHSLAVAVRSDRGQLAQWASAVIARRVSDGSWQKSYDTWLRPTLGEASAPAPTYGRKP